MTGKTTKASYTIPCASAFRDAVTRLAERRRVNVADLARSILLTLPEDMVRAAPDPGDPPPGDREETVLKSGPSEGRPWRRKPRLQVRLAPGYDVPTVRRALNMALSLDQGDLGLEIIDRHNPPPVKVAVDDTLQDELARLRSIVATLAFEPVAGGLASRGDALHVLGFAPDEHPAPDDIRTRFRQLATIHHPDSPYGSHQRMSQLNAAVEMLNA